MTIFNITDSFTKTSDNVYLTGRLYDKTVSYVGKNQFMPSTYTISTNSFYAFASSSTANTSRILVSAMYGFSMVGGNPLGDIIVDVAFPNAYYIDDNAFRECTRLNRISTPLAMSIGSSAFYGCAALTSYSFPNVEYIGESAFYGCPEHSVIEFPNLKSVGSDPAFGELSKGITEIHLPKLDIPLSHVLATSSTSSQFFSNVSIIEMGWETITSDAMKIRWKNGNTYSTADIMYHNFSLYTPQATTMSFTTQFNSYVDYISAPELKSTSVYNASYLNFSRVKEFYAPKLESGWLPMFSNNSVITEIDHPMFQGSISSYALQMCANLSSISLPRVSSLPSYFARSCSSLTYVNIESVNYIQQYAFGGCSALSHIDAQNATTVGAYAFQSCIALRSINLPNATSVGTSAFQSCIALRSINLPNATFVGSSAFFSCTALEYANLGNTEGINYSTFYYCTNLEYVEAQSASYIYSSAFYSCRNLKQVNLPNAKTVSSGAFYGASVVDLYLDKVTYFTTYALSSAVISNLYMRSISAVPTMAGTDLSRVQSVYVPSSLYQSFLTTSPWSSQSAKLISV